MLDDEEQGVPHGGGPAGGIEGLAANRGMAARRRPHCPIAGTDIARTVHLWTFAPMAVEYP
jgi:hypothetical protein